MKLLTLNWLSSKGFPVPRIAASTLYAVLVVSLGLLVLPDLASAEPSFALDTILPSGLTDKPFLEQVVTILAMVILSAVFIALGFGVVGGMTDIFTTLSEARRMGDWGLFMKNLGMVLGVVILGVVLAVLVYTWMTTISINPTVTIGS
ncbi:MAG: hypothetical protein H6972_15355 [Gammaproteobacteria bacterium]|nr:hypothetical protein [Gammaproteobacteria bacterium]